MKRVLSLFLALVLCLSLLPTAAFADGVSITATASEQAPAIGETIDVTFTVANNPGFTNVQLRLAFDSNVLKFTGLKQEANSYGQMVTAGLFGAGTSEANTVVGNEKYGSIGYINTNAINVDNTLFVAQFEVIGQGATTVGAVVQQFQNASGDTVASYEPVVSETGSITVAGISATSVTLDKTELSLEEGQNYLLTANVEPTDTTDEIVWSSSDESVATVLDGQVKALKAGNTIIKAKANDNAYAECAVEVTAEQSIVHKSSDGYNHTATAEMTGVKSLAVGGSTKTIKNIYKLSLTGHEGAWVHMDGAGTGQGAAYKLDGTAVFGVPNGVDLTKFSINIDYAYAYTADLLVTEAELTAAVGADNVSKLGLSADKLYAFLYIEDPWKNRNSGILFEITPVTVTGVEVQETMSLYEGETGNLSVSVLPATNTDDLTVTYSSGSEAVATVDANGKVTAVAPGTAVITVTAGSYTDTCTVTVKSGYVEIENVPGNGDMWAGSMNGITIKNVTVDSYQWNGKTLNVFIAEDTATATVVFNFNQNGYDNKHEETAAITNGSGTLTKTFTHNDGWSSYETTWVINFSKSVPATDISLEKTETTIRKGGNETLVAILAPENATDSITWSSSDDAIATVDGSGKVTGVAAGEATITATVGEYSADCKVTVYEVPATAVTISGDRIENGKLRLLIGEKYKPTVTITPEDTTDSVTYKSNNTSVARVSSGIKGQILAKAAGTATYTVTAGNVSASIEVEVYEGYDITVADTENGTVTASAAKAAAGTEITLTAVPNEGYQLESFDVKKGEETVTVTDGKFEMPEGNVTVSATFKEIPSVEGYTVTMGADKTVDAGENIQIPVTVGYNAAENETAPTTYKSYELTFQYDTDKLTLVTGSSDAEGKDFTVVDDNGTVTIRRYGEALNVGEAAVTLEFTAKKTGESDVKLTSAKVGTSADAQDQNIPDAAIIDNLTKITVTGYDVDLDEAFTGDGVADPEKDYTFEAKDKNYVYTVDVTVTKPDGTTDTFEVTDEDEDGVLTIPADKITGSIRIEVDEEKTAGKTFDVTIEGDAAAVTGADKAQYMTDYVLSAAEGVDLTGYTIKYKIGDGEEKAMTNNTIPGSEITGSITITVTAPGTDPEDPDRPANSWKITFEGNGKDDVQANSYYVTKGEAFTFSIEKTEGYTYIVTYPKNATEIEELTADENGNYSFTPDADVTVTVMKWHVEVNQYVALNGKTVFQVSVSEAENVGMKYDGNTMFVKSVNALGGDGKYNGEAADKYVYLVELAEGTLTVENAARKLSIVENVTCEKIEKTFNVNGSTNLDINDAQLVYDMYNNVYQDITTVGMAKFLRADIGGDRVIDVQDAIAVVNEILNPEG